MAGRGGAGTAVVTSAGNPLELAQRVLRTWVSGEQVYSWDAEAGPVWAKRF